MQPIARIVVREADRDDGGLLLGTTWRGQSFFKPGRVYEVVELFDGELTIRDVGPSCVRRDARVEARRGHLAAPTWANTVNQILEEAGRRLFWSRHEVASLARQEAARGIGDD